MTNSFDDISRVDASFWLKNVKPLTFGKLNKNISVDVAVIGGGIFGITTAYMISKQGKKVALIEGRDMISGETSRTTAHLTYVLDAEYNKLNEVYGKEKAIKINNSKLERR